MGFLRRLMGQDKRHGFGPEVTPAELLDYLESQRAAAEEALLEKYRVCPECDSNYLRVGAWAKNGAAGWIITCVNCGTMLEQTTEVDTR